MSTRFRSVRAAVVRACCILPVVFAFSFAADRPDPPKVVEEIVAKVNGDIVTRGELAETLVEMEKEAKAQGIAGPTLQQLVEKATTDELKTKIDELLLVQKGKDLDINVEADLNRFIASVQSDSKISDPDKFHDWVHQVIGVPYEEFRLRKKNELITSA
jgi:hypothetical protein